MIRVFERRERCSVAFRTAASWTDWPTPGGRSAPREHPLPMDYRWAPFEGLFDVGI